MYSHAEYPIWKLELVYHWLCEHCMKSVIQHMRQTHTHILIFITGTPENYLSENVVGWSCVAIHRRFYLLHIYIQCSIFSFFQLSSSYLKPSCSSLFYSSFRYNKCISKALKMNRILRKLYSNFDHSQSEYRKKFQMKKKHTRFLINFKFPFNYMFEREILLSFSYCRDGVQ